ncbi:MAG TPA: VirB8/TrbF family protein [Terriglobales bacterium]|nr:VirB8/TrbF family protein [Terriglobales bacterium]
MWLRKTRSEKEEGPEKLDYSHYYEHDGELRAYANRAMLLAFLCVPTTLVALAFAVYVRVQPPTVIRVDANGQADTITAPHRAFAVTEGVAAEPNEFEKRAFVRLFLERYLNFSPSSVSRNWAESLNMMTANLRRTAFTGIEKENLVGKIQDDQTSSEFQIRSLEAEKDDLLTYTAFGVKEVHRMRDHNETVDKVVSEFHVRLAEEKRSEQNPSGLLVAEYWERAIEGEKRDWVLQQTAFGKQK